MNPPRRTFTLRDAIVLVAATAVAFAWIRSIDAFAALESVRDWLYPRMLNLILTPLTFAIVGLRLLPPRPPLRRLVLQPGAAACGAVAFAFTSRFVFALTILFSESRGDLGARFGWADFGNRLCYAAISGVSDHVPVVVAWGLLFLSRRCRPEPSWIDRVGRAVGVIWLLLGLWHRLDWAIEAWREGGR